MPSTLNPGRFIVRNFCPHWTDHEQRFSWSYLMLYFIVPCAVGGFMAWQWRVPALDTLPLVIAVYSILAAVLLGLLPVIYSVVSQVDTNRNYARGERLVAERELVRLDALQDLYATVVYGAFLLVIALVCCVLLIFLQPSLSVLPPSPASIDVKQYASLGLSCFIYFAGASTALSILNVVAGMFDAMEDHVRSSKDAIRNHVTSDDESGT